ncbi:integrase catalytic domain-containing protein [Trichonephila clavipes]|nr:integrase catalytic domain-containing protein [Trichonephila clavipes]
MPFDFSGVMTNRVFIKGLNYKYTALTENFDRSFYVDDLISGGNEFKETLQTSRRAKNIMEAAGMDLRKWITNDANLMKQWKKENFNVHPVHETGNETRWKQFVANRVNEITSLTDPHSWYHCAGKENPADFLSRGLSPDCLVSNSRFNYNCRYKSKKVGPLTVAEFKESEIKLIKHAQRSLFDKKEIPSSISNLFPFVDGEGIVRVGGRLENASVPYLHKHTAILPKGSKLSKFYFNSLHIQDFHVGLQGLLNAVRQKFWPLSGRSIAPKTVHQCVTCFKSRPILSSQIMGNLPSERVNISSPFTIAGLDLCGPFLVK